VSPDIRDIVFVAQMPHARDGVALEYSPWFQFLLGLLDVEIEYGQGVELGIPYDLIYPITERI
jgi:hypothetical protein